MGTRSIKPQKGDIWEFVYTNDHKTHWLLLKQLEPDNDIIILESYETYWRVLSLEEGIVVENIIALGGRDATRWKKVA